jgi:hypothetical protein
MGICHHVGAQKVSDFGALPIFCFQIRDVQPVYEQGPLGGQKII